MTGLKKLAYFALFACAASFAAAQSTERDATAAEADPVPAAETGAPATTGDADEAEQALPLVFSATETTLDEWLWLKRPLVVFADSAADPRFVEQMQLILERLDALDLRDVVVITDTDPAARSSVRQTLRARGFMLVVISKDGTIVARKPAPWDVREISRSIDKLPLRKQEIRDRRETLRP